MKDVRIRFRKQGRAKYISHLDLTRTMTRAVRRAGLPVWYTEGFNRHPYLTFSAPLSLGFEGMAESMDFRLVEEIPMEDVVARLNAVLPEGLTVCSASEPVMKAGEIAAARYRLTFSGDTGRLRDFLAQSAVTVQKRSKKGVTKEIDLKPSLERADIREREDGTVEVELTLPCSSTETINPALIPEACRNYTAKQTGKEPALFCDIVRLQLLGPEEREFV